MKRDTIIRIVLALVGLAVLGYAIYVGEQKGKQVVHHLTIVHVNDTHSHFEPERSGPNKGLGGIIERAAFVDSVRKANPGRTLVVHGGDFGQGTSYFTVLEGVVETEMMNAINYDVAALGNHEFDNGIEALTERVTSRVAERTGVAPENIYIRYLPTDAWGWNGGNF